MLKADNTIPCEKPNFTYVDGKVQAVIPTDNGVVTFAMSIAMMIQAMNGMNNLLNANLHSVMIEISPVY
jgi:hypothetical protein